MFYQANSQSHHIKLLYFVMRPLNAKVYYWSKHARSRQEVLGKQHFPDVTGLLHQ